MIVLPFPPATLSGHAKGKAFWGKHTVTQEWREDACKTAMAASLPAFPDGKAYEDDILVRVAFYPPNRRGDRVNFPNRMKPIFDGLADALGVNDARFVPAFEFHPPQKPGRVEITIEVKKGE